MSPFDAAWDIVKAYGEGFRSNHSRLSLDNPAVTELVPILNDSKNRTLNPFYNKHWFKTDRESGTGVSGTYYHGAPFNPLSYNDLHQRRLNELLERLRSKGSDDRLVYIPPPKNVIATGPMMRRMSTHLLRNVNLEGEGYGGPRYGTYGNEIEGVDQPKTDYKRYYETDDATYALPKTFEDEVDILLAPYDRTGRNSSSYGDETDMHIARGRSAGAKRFRDNDLFDYLGRTPLVRRIVGNDIGERSDDDWNWMNDPDVLQVLGERMLDTGGLSPMNILLGEYGHDAVAPIVSSDRGAPYAGEITQGSVLLPPTTDNWWEDYHPIEDGSFERLEPHHVEAWLDDMERARDSSQFRDHLRRVDSWRTPKRSSKS